MFAAEFSATQGTDNLPPAIEAIFIRIYIILNTVLTRFEKQKAAKQEQLLPVTLSFTLFECSLA